MVLETSLQNLAIIVLAATSLAFIARKGRQPVIIAYIVAGLLLGSAGLGIISGGESISLMSELGLAFLLFLVGLEIRLEEIRDIVRPVTIIALLQMALVATIGFLTAYLLGFSLIPSIFIAGAVMYSSTAVVVKLLSDKDEISSLPGKLDVGMLLIEDLVVVLLLALIGTGSGSPARVAASVAEILVMAGAVAALSILSSRYLLPTVFEKIGDNSHAFFTHSIAWLFLMVSATSYLGISMEIGAFFAGLSLAQLPYSREMQERIRPLTNFFMAIFFINVGLGLDRSVLSGMLPEAVAAAVILMAGKMLVIFLLTDRMKFTPETSFKAAINKAQISEFALVLAALGFSQGIVGQEVVSFLSIVAVLTMGASSYLISYNDAIYRRLEDLLSRLESERKQDVEIRELDGHALVIGYDALSRHAVSILENRFEDVVVVDRNPRNIDELANSNLEYIYGDFKHGEIRNASGLKKADLILSFSPDEWVNRKVLEEAGDATVFVKADSMKEAGELYDLGAHYVMIKNVLAADKLEDYIRLFINDVDLFREEVKSEIERIEWSGKE